MHQCSRHKQNLARPRMFDDYRTISQSNEFAASSCEFVRGRESGRRVSNPRPSAWKTKVEAATIASTSAPTLSVLSLRRRSGHHEFALRARLEPGPVCPGSDGGDREATGPAEWIACLAQEVARGEVGGFGGCLGAGRSVGRGTSTGCASATTSSASRMLRRLTSAAPATGQKPSRR
jgi:hypothetical protein